MMRARIIAGIFVMLFAFMPSARSAPTVKEIVIKNTGAGQVEEGFVLAQISLKPGAELDSSILNKDVKTLSASGRFSWVGVDIEPIDGGVRVILSIRNKLLLVKPVTVRGCEYFYDNKILDLMGLQPNDLVDDQVMGVRVQAVIEKYRKDYFPDVKVTWKITELDHARGTAEVAVTVEEGNRSLVKKVEFSGNKVISSGALRKCMKQPAFWNPCWWLRKRSYDEGEFESAKAEIFRLYLAVGYRDAKVSISEVPYDQHANLKVVVKIDEGPLYRFDKMSVRGAKLFPENAFNSMLARKGQPASDEAMRASCQAIQDFYGSRGYVDCSVRPVLDTDDINRIVNVDLVVTEGTPARIGNIKIEGNTKTKDKVIRREVLVYPGEIFNEVKVKRSEKILNNLGYFKTVSSYPVKTLVPDVKDLIFEVEEKSTGQFGVSAGFSSIDKVMGMVELSQANFALFGWPYFTGAGQKLKLSAYFGSVRKYYEISFIEPWFLDRKLSFKTDLFWSEVSYTDYTLWSKGGAITFGKPITKVDRIELQYGIEKEGLSDIADTNAYVSINTGDLYYFSNEKDAFKSSVKLTLVHDTRDSAFLPTRGNRTGIFAGISGGILGLDTDIYQLGASMNQYVPLWLGHVLCFRARCEVVDSYSDTEEVPIMDRLFIGGGRTLRGFDYRDVGPKAISQTDYNSGNFTGTHRPIGGKTFAMATAEYTIPVVSSVRLALFFDVGNVWSDAYDFQFDNLAMSTGAGLRLDFPGFPIKIDYGWVTHKDESITDKAPWVIWIGPDY